jgi:tryptophanyl-tRNA synthetase
VSNLLSIYAAFTNRTPQEVEADFAGQGYGLLKNTVADAVTAFAEPFAKRTAELLDDRAELDRILARGAERANQVAAETVRAAYERVGFVAPFSS